MIRYSNHPPSGLYGTVCQTKDKYGSKCYLQAWMPLNVLLCWGLIVWDFLTKERTSIRDGKVLGKGVYRRGH